MNRARGRLRAKAKSVGGTSRMNGELAAAMSPPRWWRSRSIRSPLEKPKTRRRITSSVIRCMCGRSSNGRPAGKRSISARVIAAISSR